jgi:hypothetical protein
MIIFKDPAPLGTVGTIIKAIIDAFSKKKQSDPLKELRDKMNRPGI